MNLKFVVSHLDQQLGPFTEAELKAKWAKGELLPIDYVYDELKKDWILFAERFEWAAAPTAESAPPPLKRPTDKAKTPPAPTANTSPTMPATTTQQKPVPPARMIEAPVLNIPQPTAPPGLTMDDPMPTVVSNQVPAAAALSHPAQVTLVNGIGEIDLSATTPGRVELMVTDSGSHIKQPASLTIQVRPLEPVEIAWSFDAQPVVGSDFSVTLKAVDGHGAHCAHFRAQGTLFVRASESREIPVQIENGQAVVKLANTKSEKWSLRFQYSSPSHLRLPTESVVDWQPGVAARLILDAPADINAGHSLKVQVRAVDEYGNVARTFHGTVVLAVKAS